MFMCFCTFVIILVLFSVHTSWSALTCNLFQIPASTSAVGMLVNAIVMLSAFLRVTVVRTMRYVAHKTWHPYRCLEMIETHHIHRIFFRLCDPYACIWQKNKLVLLSKTSVFRLTKLMRQLCDAGNNSCNTIIASLLMQSQKQQYQVLQMHATTLRC
jgi:hypothetical protein